MFKNSIPSIRFIFSFTANSTFSKHFRLGSRGYYGTVRYGITVRLDFGKKYDTELRTEFLEKVRYGNTILYFPYRTVLQ